MIKRLLQFCKKAKKENSHLDDRSVNQSINDHSLWGFVILLAIFCGGYVIAIPLAGKIIDVWFFQTTAGVLAYSLTFPCTDIVGEVYGHKYAKKLVWAGLIAVVSSFVLIQLALIWPSSSIYMNEEAFNNIFKISARITIASVITYWISQNTDVWIFSIIKHITKGKYLWFRNNVSTIISQCIDSFIFIFLAFYNIMPIETLLFISLGTWAVKVFIAVLDTPLVYLGVKLIRKHSPSLKR